MIHDFCSDISNAFWHRKKHIVNLPYVKDFNEKNIPTKACPIQMNAKSKTVKFCKKEIHDLLAKKLIRNSKSLGLVLLFILKKMLKLRDGLLA